MRTLVSAHLQHQPTDPVQLQAAHLQGRGQHFITLGAGMSMLVTTAELAEWIEKLQGVLGDCRVADLRAAMQPLPGVAS